MGKTLNYSGTTGTYVGSLTPDQPSYYESHHQWDRRRRRRTTAASPDAAPSTTASSPSKTTAGLLENTGAIATRRCRHFAVPPLPAQKELAVAASCSSAVNIPTRLTESATHRHSQIRSIATRGRQLAVPLNVATSGSNPTKGTSLRPPPHRRRLLSLAPPHCSAFGRLAVQFRSNRPPCCRLIQIPVAGPFRPRTSDGDAADCDTLHRRRILTPEATSLSKKEEGTEANQGSSKAHATNLTTKMVTLKYSGSSGVREHILRMNDMASQLKGLDMKISKGFLVHFIMTSLPAQFGPFKINYNTQEEKWKMSELIFMCVQEEERLKSEQPDSAQVSIIGPSKGKGKKFGKGSMQGNKSASVTKTDKASFSGPNCHFCRAKGHMKKECQKFREWFGKESGSSTPRIINLEEIQDHVSIPVIQKVSVPLPHIEDNDAPKNKVLVNLWLPSIP
ncbi:LOW QUALITY PROTEIN: hypothetical protein RJ640_000579, partial [Escallonia rubra]